MAEHYASPGWSELPIDLLIHVTRLLELPKALAFRAVCPSWRSASTAAMGVPHTCRTPWLVSLAEEPLTGEKQNRSRRPWDPTVASKFRSLMDEKTFQVSVPWGKAVALCGASHGWLIVANELSDLVLYHPFTATTISLPPISIESVRVDKGKAVGLRYLFYGADDSVYNVGPPGSYFYDKVVLSGSPTTPGTIALLVHTDGKRVSFARVGDGSRSWRRVFEIWEERDSFADCVHHNGRFYILTMKGMLMTLYFDGRRHKPKREMIITQDERAFFGVVTRYLVSTPWGHLLQVRVILDTHRENGVKVEIDKLDLKSRKVVGLTPAEALQGHMVFLGQNSPSVLSTNEFPELRPDCIYFTTPRLKNECTFWRPYNQWNGVKVYDLKKQTLEVAFPSGVGNHSRIDPSEVWFTPSLLP